VSGREREREIFIFIFYVCVCAYQTLNDAHVCLKIWVDAPLTRPEAKETKVAVLRPHEINCSRGAAKSPKSSPS
jgi:hypothetical protein